VYQADLSSWHLILNQILSSQSSLLSNFTFSVYFLFILFKMYEKYVFEIRIKNRKIRSFHRTVCLRASDFIKGIGMHNNSYFSQVPLM